MTAEIPEDGQIFESDLLRKISELEIAAGALSKEVPDLASAVRRNRLTIRLILLGLALFLLALIGSGYALYEERQTNNRLRENVASVQAVVAAQKATRSQMLCPLYSAFVSSFTPAQRAKQPPENLAFYDNAVAAIEKAYQALGCPQPPVH